MTRILLVDGCSDDCDWNRERLRAAEHEVVCASDAATADERIDQRSFDMIITEWMLRDMSGLELAHVARRQANGRHARAVVLTARNDPAAVEFRLMACSRRSAASATVSGNGLHWTPSDVTMTLAGVEPVTAL